MLQMSSDNLDPLGYIPLHIPTDPLYPELDDMDTFKTFALTMEENSVKPTQRCPNTPLSACSIPDTPEGRRALVDKIFLLFEEELKRLDFSDEQISAITGALETLVPDVFSMDFEPIFQDRVYGFFGIMKTLRKLFFETGDRNIVTAEARRLSAGFDDNISAQAVLAVLPHEQFSDVLHPGTGRLNCLTEILEFCPHFRVEQLDPVLTAYFNKISEIKLGESNELKVRKSLISALYHFDAKRPDLDLHFKKLSDRLEEAVDKDSLVEAVGQFGAEKLNISLANGANSTGAHNLPQLFGELKRADYFLGARKPVGYSVVSALTSNRDTVRKCIADLFNANIEDENLRRFLEEDVESLLSTDDPYFDEALTDRNCGVIELLKLTYNDAIRRRGDVETAIIGFRRLIEGIVKLPWKSRDGEQSRRNVLMKRLEKRRVSERLMGNAKCFDSLCSRMNGTAELLGEVRDSFMGATGDLDVNFDMCAQWFSVFIENLSGFVGDNSDKVPELKNALNEIRDIFESATKPREILGAIDTFVQRTLPALREKSTASQPSA